MRSPHDDEFERDATSIEGRTEARGVAIQCRFEPEAAPLELTGSSDDD
jgi:hypothetical protein